MPQNSDEPRDDRELVRNQLDRMKAATSGNLAWDSTDAADHGFLYVPGRVLVDGDREADFLTVLGARPEFAVRGETRESDRSTDNVVSYVLPAFTGEPEQDVRVALRIFDQELGPGAVTPEHYVHVATNGNGRACPATEPSETGVRAAWPPAVTDLGLGSDVVVAVVDTGWPEGAEDPPDVELGPGDPLPDLLEYDGHGMYAEAIVKSQAPGATIRRVKFEIVHDAVAGGVVPERDLVIALEAALGQSPAPRVITMSAGCHTYNNQPLKAFEDLWTTTLSAMPDTVLLAAAGNDASPLPFYPAASWWATGVGSLDADDRVSSFSNYLDSADVFVLGRNHVNLFPHGRYVCQWAPDVGDVREFRTRWARWSGTSFSTPLLAGRIAAFLNQQHSPEAPTQARALAQLLIQELIEWRHDDEHGDHRIIGRQHFA